MKVYVAAGQNSQGDHGVPNHSLVALWHKLRMSAVTGPLSETTASYWSLALPLQLRCKGLPQGYCMTAAHRLQLVDIAGCLP